MNKIYESILINEKPLTFYKTIEDIFNVQYGKINIINTFDKDEAEYLFELIKNGYIFERKIND